LFNALVVIGGGVCRFRARGLGFVVFWQERHTAGTWLPLGFQVGFWELAE